MATTFCISGAVLKRAGLNVSPSLSSGAIKLSASNFIVDTWINDAESEINCLTKRNWTDAYANLNADVRDVLRAAASKRAAIDCVNFDMASYGSTQAQFMMNVLRDGFLSDIETLKDIEIQRFIVGA